MKKGAVDKMLSHFITAPFKAYGRITVKVKATDLYFDPKKCQYGYGSKYVFRCENNYEDKFASLRFRYSNGYTPEDAGCRHCESMRGTADRPRFFMPSKFVVHDMTY